MLEDIKQQAKLAIAGVQFYLLQNAVAIDQLGNTLLGGYADETLSSRAYRAWINGKVLGKVFKPTIDALFRLLGDRNHCYKSWQAEIKRKQLPRNMGV